MSIPKVCTLPLVLLVALVGLAAPAQAAPSKVGPVQNLSLSAAGAPGGYRLTSAWSPLANATAYKAALTDTAGSTLASVIVTAPSWVVTVAGTPGTNLKVTVTPLEGKRPGNPASAMTTLPDVTAPVGSFTVSTSGMEATITQQSLSDDGTPAASIRRTVSWGDGSAPQLWSAGGTLTHSFATIGRYVPTITLADATGNAVTLTLKAAVFGDYVAPVGVFTVAPTTSAIAGWSKVRLDQVDLVDNYTPSELVERSVAWGDGTVEAWPAGSPLAHQYAAAGTYAPTVVLVDEAGNIARYDTEKVAVTVDAVGPVLKLRSLKSNRVTKWRTVRGTAVDTGVGTAQVAVLAIEKRQGRWFSYNAGTGKWVRAKSKAKAWKAAKPVLDVPVQGEWTAKLAGLRQGRLKLRVTGTDHLGNSSAVRAGRRLSRA